MPSQDELELAKALAQAQSNRDARNEQLEQAKKGMPPPAASSSDNEYSYSEYSYDDSDIEGVPPPSGPPPQKVKNDENEDHPSDDSEYTGYSGYSGYSSDPGPPNLPPPAVTQVGGKPSGDADSDDWSTSGSDSDPGAPSVPMPPTKPIPTVESIAAEEAAAAAEEKKKKSKKYVPPPPEKMKEAATKIQCLIRKRLARKNLNFRKVQYAAATKMQSIVRGRQGRLHAKHVRGLQKNDEAYEVYLMQQTLLDSQDADYLDNEAHRLEQKVKLLKRRLKKRKNPKMQEELEMIEEELVSMKAKAEKARHQSLKMENRHEKAHHKNDEGNVKLSAHKILMEDLMMREEQERQMRQQRKKARAKIRAKKRKKGQAKKRPGDPAGWHSRIDPKTRRKYYINDETKETSWKKPVDIEGGEKYQPTEEEKKKKKEWHGWKKYNDPKSGRPYWYNKETKQTTWHDPKVAVQLKGQNQRAKVKAAAKKKRKWRRVLLLKVRLKKGADIEADLKKDGTFEGWKVYIDKKSGRPYWYNKDTKKTQWHDPHGISKKKESAWKEFTDKKSGKKYYYNGETKETSWHKPKGFHHEHNKHNKESPENTQEGHNHHHKEHWKTATTKDGRKYYYNVKTKKTSWKPPPGFEDEKTKTNEEETKKS
jgi:hypothetical protein